MTLANPVIVVVIAAFVWWFSTGLVLYAVRRSETGSARAPSVMPMMTLAGIGGIVLLVWSRDIVTPTGSYAGFFGALLVWAWHEAAFLTGWLTGPRKGECPPGLSGWQRFGAAWQAIRDHELAILATGIVLIAVLAGGTNHFGLATFLLLWGMRISAKLIIFLGAPNAVSELMPQRIAYLKSYFNTDRTTAFFPLAIGVALSLLVVLAFGAQQASSEFALVGHILLSSFMALAIIEHFILVLPVSDTALWRWAMPDRKQPDAVAIGKRNTVS